MKTNTQARPHGGKTAATTQVLKKTDAPSSRARTKRKAGSREAATNGTEIVRPSQEVPPMLVLFGNDSLDIGGCEFSEAEFAEIIQLAKASGETLDDWIISAVDAKLTAAREKATNGERVTLSESIMGEALHDEVLRVSLLEKVAVHDLLLFAMHGKLSALGVAVDKSWVLQGVRQFVKRRARTAAVAGKGGAR